MSVTIKDIAKRVGVAPSTVSRVVNGSASISEETKSRILQVMEEMNYHPNSLARNLVNGSTFCIGLIMDARDEGTFSNTFFNRSVYAIEKVTQANGYNLLIANDDSSMGVSAVEKLVLEKKADGLILPSNCVRTGLVEMLLRNECPFVVLGEPAVMKRKHAGWTPIMKKGRRRRYSILPKRALSGSHFCWKTGIRYLRKNVLPVIWKESGLPDWKKIRIS